MMEIVALVVSIVSLVVSIIVAGVEYFRDYKIAKMELDYEFYSEIYKDHLIRKIPAARRVIFFDSVTHKLRDTDKLLDELKTIATDSVYFMYKDKEYYNSLKKALQDLENYIVSACNQEFVAEEQAQFWDKLQKGLDKIYATISKAYWNTSRRR